MKKIIIFLIKLYQKTPLSSHLACKYIPTCSNYAIEAINTYGVPKGIILSIKRIIKCNPFSKGGLDLVPVKEKKMKKNKNIVKLLIPVILLTLCSGCIKRDEMEDINIITTVYPLEYILNKLYGDKAVINSIYPDGINTDEYQISSKEYKDFSKKDLFVYNGISSDKDIALNLLNKNKNIMIMDANFGMEKQYGIEELWLDPSNLLMASQNIKNGLTELIDSKYIKTELTEAYNNLKIEFSYLDAEIKLINEQAKDKTIIIASPSLQFLSKYGFKTILLDDKKENEKNIAKITSLINEEEEKYIFILENEEENNAIKKIKKETKAEFITIDKIDNLTDEERDNKEDYLSLMKKNLELLRKGTE